MVVRATPGSQATASQASGLAAGICIAVRGAAAAQPGADSWVALGNAIGGQGQGQLAPQAAAVTQQRCYHKHGQGQAGCMQLECT